MQKRQKLTVHSIVRNEPFVYYSIKSVYDYVDSIFLYDTGSNDAHTLEDIQTLISEDKDHKIVFKKVTIDIDETDWTLHTIYRKQRDVSHRRKRILGHVRLQQMEETCTPFFMIVDGDEVHYKQTMMAIRTTLNWWPHQKICGFIPSLWFADMSNVLRFTHKPSSGRIFMTGEIGIDLIPFGEMGTNKRTGAHIVSTQECSFNVRRVLPFAHFEPFLKPWRDRESAPYVLGTQKHDGSLPEAIQENDYYVRRFLDGTHSD
ncbi:MAG TPA: hypothetical protein ENI27_06590 [bacterium]|nr:hypothetical protein [bacterium]